MSDQPAAAPDLLTSPLHERHVALGAKFAEFGGWSMPLEYPSGVVKEHTAVREAVGIFDVSHLGKAMVSGPGAAAYVNATLTNDLGRIAPGKAQYTLCCDDETGGIVDDLIVYLHDEERVLLVPNAANTAEVVRRLAAGAPEGVTVDRPAPRVRRAGGAGHEVRRGARLDRAADRPRLHVLRRDGLPWGDHRRVPHRLHRRTRLRADRPHRGGRAAVGRADGRGEELGMLACGLGARDTLRTEMGYPLHGQDISLDVTPNQARLGWAVGWSKEAFWGREVLLAEKERGPERVLRGLVAVGRGIPRPGMSVSLTPDVLLGEITSGTFSPTLRKGIGLALLPSFVNPEAEVGVDVRGRREIFQLVKPPFVDPSVREA